MDDPPIASFYILSILFLVLLSAFFSGSETAFSALNRVRMKNMAENGSARAALVLRLSDDFNGLISTILVGNNVVNIAASALCTLLFIHYFGDTGAMLSTIVLTIVVLAFGEVTPKALAKESPEKYALFSAPILYCLKLLLHPIVVAFAYWKKLLTMIFPITGSDSGITEQEFMIIIDEAEHDGAIDEDDKLLIHNAMEFKDLEAQDILTPRVHIVGATRETSLDEMAAIFQESGFSRIPIYDGSIDNIFGIVHLRDFFELMLFRAHSDGEGHLEDIITPAVFVAPSVKINDLFRELQKDKVHLAVVTDEYGGTAGIITIEDILEELVGEIWDESDEIIEEFIDLGDNRYKVICSADVDKLFAFFDLTGDVDSYTVGGWIMDILERIPEEGDAFDYENLSITVSKVGQRKVLECIIEVHPDRSGDENEDHPS